MSIFKCKMCGGDLEVTEGVSIAECEYCGAMQTLPKAVDENLQNIFNRANTLRIKSEFDKAEKLYEKIIQSDETQAEAYWGLILCKYGIEYVDDPATFKKVPTCHRASYESIIADDDYKSALQYADLTQRAVYEEQAGEIDRIQKEILALAQKEEKYDVFICYKETDSSGARTQDSVIANDIYYQLTNEGFKVFYAAITLEGKLGSAYEPIIFAALNSAKVMLAIGTKPEFFNAVWVKNEWSRYLKIVQKDRSKLLIPCFRDMDAYELPEEFAHLQAQDMSKIGFINDVVRGIKKVVSSAEPKPTVVKETVISGGNANTAPLLKRAFMFLEDGDWTSANEYCEKVLDIDPECAEAYLGKLMVELKATSRQNLENFTTPFDGRNNFQKAMRFADENLKKELQGYIDFIINRNLTNVYNEAVSAMKSATTETEYKKAADKFAELSDFKDSKKLAKECLKKADEANTEELYNSAVLLMKDKKHESYEKAITIFEKIGEWKDSKELANKCSELAVIAKKQSIYNKAIDLIKNATSEADIDEAIKLLKTIPDFKNANELINNAKADWLGKYKKFKTYIEILENEAKFTDGGIEKEIKNSETIKSKLLYMREKLPSIINELCVLENESANIRTRLSAINNELSTLGLFAGKRKKELKQEEKDLNEKNNDLDLKITENKKIVSDYISVEEIDSRLSNIEVKVSELKNTRKLLESLPSLRQELKEDRLGNHLLKIFNMEQERKNAKIGDTVKFGEYPYNENKDIKPIEWLVLQRSADNMLLISKYALDCKKYNDVRKDVTWETCTLRKWLNNDFVNSAFSAAEKAMIPTVTVSADKNPDYSTNPGNATKDKVFLLSITEANKYFSSKSARACKPTEYAVAEGAYVDSDNGNCWWWLRSPGDTQSHAAFVDYDGDVSEYGNLVNIDNYAVRPALWIDLNS